MKYKISAPHSSDHFLHIELIVESVDQAEMLFQLPSWRPGRYELGNFAKNIRQWDVFNENEETLTFRKISKDCWKVNTEGAKEVHVHYSYYAAQPDGGSCWVNDEMIYINPIHCSLFVPERTQEECTLELAVPDPDNYRDYQVATSLATHNSQPITHNRIFSASNYDELVDSPLLASATLQHHTYESEKIIFNIWIQGECTPDWTKIINDFRRFSTEQIKMMGDLPGSKLEDESSKLEGGKSGLQSPVSNFQPQFHFLILALPYKFHHGVEHLRSTVLALGPGNELMNEPLYGDFIGVASHELFHVWNIKTIRPHELMPYNYTKENYSRLGFVYEGVTTYYGDLFLARSGVYSVDQFLKEISERVQRHFHNYGRFNLSVADSSFDTWLDGYVPGIPSRKTSIYDEGCLIALMTDLIIRRKTNNEKSLDDVMRTLYHDFGKKNIGYTEHDYITIIENYTNESVSDFFIDFVYGTDDYEPLLTDLLNHFGCSIEKTDSPNIHEHHFGFKATAAASVIAVAPDSPAYRAGLGKDDEIIAVNETKVEGNLNDLLKYYLDETRSSKPEIRNNIRLKVFTPMKKLKTIILEKVGEESDSYRTYFSQYKLVKTELPSTSQQKSFSEWMKSASRQAYSFMN